MAVLKLNTSEVGSKEEGVRPITVAIQAVPLLFYADRVYIKFNISMQPNTSPFRLTELSRQTKEEELG